MSTAIIFPSDVFDTSRPHSMWEAEVKVASDLGQVYLLDFEALLEGHVRKALRKMPEGGGAKIIYHGWMMTPDVYGSFYHGLQDKGYHLITHPTEYVGCHHISNWYPVIEEFTPRTVIVHSDNVREILDAARTFGDASLIIKDFVSSQKHNWKEACFIPSGNDVISAARVIATFVALQKEVDGIQGGVVLREFVPLKSIGTHPKSGMPLSQEFRAFILNGKTISQSKYWEFGNYAESKPPSALLKKVSSRIYEELGSKFFTVDLAQKENGEWICIEVGDGQVSSLPELGDKKEFYSRLMSYDKR